MNPAAAVPLRALKAALLALCCGASVPVPCASGADDRASVAAAEGARAVTMQRFMVSATRIDKNPWRYASIGGFEVLTRASDSATVWWLDALRRGIAIENEMLPADWLPESPVPNTVIIDDTDLSTVPTTPLRSQAVVFSTPGDAITWGDLSGKTSVWYGKLTAHDQDTWASNLDVYGADTGTAACTISLRRVYRCAPPLPGWLVEGLLGQDCGIFREGFMPTMDAHVDRWIRYAAGPGTLWVSLDETQRLLKDLKKDTKAKIAIPPLGELFSEGPFLGKNAALWESEAGLFVRWGVIGPGHEDPAMSRAFLELVRRARREPVTEKVFTECFGFGYSVMEVKLDAFLRTVLAQPTSVELNISPIFADVDLKAATADQIGRILGDWLRMEAGSFGPKDREMGDEFLHSAGRMLERAYRDDNGLPPDVDPGRGAGRSAGAGQGADRGPAVVMKPFVVSSTKIHDPRLLSVYGLFEHDVGDDDRARDLLEAAARLGAVRPSGSIALAEIRYAQAMAKPLGAGGRLSAEQATSILEPLQAALPPSPDTYRVMVETWEHGEAKPTAGDIDRLAEGVEFFPRYTSLAYFAALICTRNGYLAQAEKLMDEGVLFATGGKSRKSFENLRAALVARRASEGK